MDGIERLPFGNGGSPGFSLPGVDMFSLSDFVSGGPSMNWSSSLGGSIANAAISRMFSGPGYGRYGALVAQLNSTIGGMWGLGPGLLIGGIAGSLASNIGPDPSTGPNGQAWLGVNDEGLLTIAGSSGDNGVAGADVERGLWPSLDLANEYLTRNGVNLSGLPEHFQVRGGGGSWGGQNPGLEPTIELDGYMAPWLNDASLLRALAQRGFIPQDPNLGTDPIRVFNGINWAEPESIHPYWRAGVQEMTESPGGAGLGFLTFDPARAQPYQYDEWGGIVSGSQPQAQSALVGQTYGQTYNQLQPGPGGASAWPAMAEIGGA